jgi:hypothetical protein
VLGQDESIKAAGVARQYRDACRNLEKKAYSEEASWHHALTAALMSLSELWGDSLRVKGGESRKSIFGIQCCIR